MTKLSNPAIEPWMEELWSWADKFELSEEEIPREVNVLLALTKLELPQKSITELPKSISNLSSLKILNLEENIELIELPESRV